MSFLAKNREQRAFGLYTQASKPPASLDRVNVSNSSSILAYYAQMCFAWLKAESLQFVHFDSRFLASLVGLNVSNSNNILAYYAKVSFARPKAKNIRLGANLIINFWSTFTHIILSTERKMSSVINRSSLQIRR